MTSQIYASPTRSNTSALAIVSLVFGVLTWIVLPLVGALVAIICGRLAMKEIKEAQPGELIGANLARAGMLLARIQVVLVLIYIPIFFITHSMMSHTINIQLPSH